MQSAPDISAPRKRRRTAKSCEQCRHRKVGCDQAHPCGPCRRSRDHLTCTYRDTAAGAPDYGQPGPHNLDNGHNTPHTVSTRPNPHQASRPEVLVAGVVPDTRVWAAQGNHHRETDAPSSQTRLPAENGGSADQTIQRLEERIQRLEAEVRNTQQGLDRNLPKTSLSVGATTAPRLRFTRGKVKLFAQSHWVHTAEKVFDLGSFDSQIEPTLGLDREEWTKACSELRSLRKTVKASRLAQLDMPLDFKDLHKTVPSRDVCELLVAYYVGTFGRMYNIVSVPEFQEQLNKFWIDAESLPKLFFMKLSLVLAIGAPFTDQHHCKIDADTLKRSTHQWIYAVQSWLSGPAEKSTQNLDGLQVLCLLAVARHVNGLGISSPVFSTTSLVSMARQMGLNRDTGEFPLLSRSQAQMMTSLWSAVVELALLSHLESGGPLIGLEELGARQPGNSNHSYFMDESVSEGPLGRKNMATYLMLLKSQGLRIQALNIINNGIGPQTIYESVVELADQLRKACTEASAFFSANARDLGPESVFHRMYIDMYLRKHILMLHRPFMLAAQEDPRFHLSRKVCLESCMIIASYIHEQHNSVGLLDLSRMMIHGSGFLRGALSLDVIVTLGYEVITQLQEEGSLQEPNTYDPARELARSGREPVIRHLENIRGQLAKSIAQGDPSLKRFIMVSALLSKIKALESGGNVRDAHYDSVKNAVQVCSKSLEAYLDQQVPRPGDADAATMSQYDGVDLNLDTMSFEALMNPLLLFKCPEF